jgi:hypothetical protein
MWFRCVIFINYTRVRILLSYLVKDLKAAKTYFGGVLRGCLTVLVGKVDASAFYRQNNRTQCKSFREYRILLNLAGRRNI